MENGVPEDELILDIIIEEEGKATIALFMLDENDLIAALTHRLSMVGSDGFGASTSGPLAQGKPHPRAFGTFPRVLGKYVREKRALNLEDAVFKMTGLPARRYGLRNRGILMPGNEADIVIFDPFKIIDKAEFKDPFKPPLGIEYVFITGKTVVEKGIYNGNVYGTILGK